ncbi:D-aminoacyl-tRNA deacylase [Eshraghiella crossota]|jgi:D-tyrosyl-tRNA(Tyr) deacylase|uniref:D-aminoacyl-tRNA deacylase n=1 Tax=Eshraghiella crossota DSM 2876 TaxID=511680 RepID=D4RYF5_9FIRM|nr:D-aminoacyl-tRNA deacylase [Butyrivibrio crossotus]EFF69055.1 D-tyrosyl-tRNA(Tyr) deacylase [Butyrivibrio crossotus DSM 2876]UWO50837.1 D-aminoacyl-tRNA deacylase [Butyrivibrio crossotus]
MKVVIQRVLNASVRVDGNITGKIKKGLLIFLGIESGDSDDMLKKYADKIVRMRIFEDENGKTNRALSDVNGELLIVSQFTLCADCSHGNRPSFIGAKEPVEAKRMYEKFISVCREQVPVVEHGEFGADMKVELLNDGPFTIIL